MPMEGFDGPARHRGLVARRARPRCTALAPSVGGSFLLPEVQTAVLSPSFSGGRSPGSRSSSSQCRYRPRRGAGERSVLLTCNLSAAGRRVHAHGSDGNSSSFQRTGFIGSTHSNKEPDLLAAERLFRSLVVYMIS